MPGAAAEDVMTDLSARMPLASPGARMKVCMLTFMGAMRGRVEISDAPAVTDYLLAEAALDGLQRISCERKCLPV